MKAILFALAATSAVFGGCCASAEMKANAKNVIGAMRELTASREASYADSMSETSRQVMTALQRQCVAEWRSAVLERRLNVIDAIAKKKDYWRKRVAADLEHALDPALENLRQREADERTRNAADPTLSRDRQYLLAAQLASTLAIGQQQAEKLAAEAERQLDNLQADLLKELDPGRSPPAEWLPADTPAEVRTAVDQLRSPQQNTYLTAMGRGFDELVRFVDAASALTLFAQGLLGDNLGAKITAALQTKGDYLLSGFHDKVADWASKLDAKNAGEIAKADTAIETTRSSKH